MDPNNEYYCNIISKGRNELQVFETNDFTLINSIELDNDQPVKRLIWVPASKTGDEDEQEPFHIVCLLPQALLVISPMVGIIDMFQLELEEELNDICYFNDQIWGCFNQGIIEIRYLQKKLMKPIKSVKQNFISIVTHNEGDSSGLLALSSNGNMFKINKRQVKSYDDPKVSAELSKVEFIKQDYSGDIIFGNHKKVLINGEPMSITDFVNYRAINDVKFIFTKNSVKVLSPHTNELALGGNYFIDVCPHGKEYNIWKFIYKQGNSINVLESDLSSRTINLDSNGHSSNGTTEGEKPTNKRTNKKEEHFYDDDEIDLDQFDKPDEYSAEELFTQLTAAVDNESKSQVINVCAGSCKEDSIKYCIPRMNNTQQLFLLDTLISNISKNSLDSFNLSLWLKWELIFNVNLLSSLKPKRVKALHASLLTSLQYYPNLLSIKGKLSLLKSQQDLKQKLAELNAQEDVPLEPSAGRDGYYNDEDDNTINMSTVNGDITNPDVTDHKDNEYNDDSVFIANGENDEDDSLVEAQAQDDVDEDEEY